MYKLVFIGAFFLLGSTDFSLGAASPARGSFAAAQDDDAQVRELSDELGLKHGVTFTIEEALFKDGQMDRLRSYRHRKLQEGMDLKAALDGFTQSVPDFTWHADLNNPKIIHIVDKHLIKRPGYALDQVIGEIDFQGTVNRLVDTIAAKGIPISSLGPSDVSDAMGTDFKTQVQVKGKSLKVRDALTDFVPLDGRGPILWVAETRIEDPDQTSYIRFRGFPMNKPVPKQ